MSINLPEQFKIVDATAGPVTTNGGVTGDYVSLKNAVEAYLVLQFTQAAAHATSIQPTKATAVAGTGATNITVSQQIWSNLDTATSDTLVARTAATSYALPSTTKKMQVIFRIDPQSLGSDYDVLGFTVSDSSQATNFVSGQYFILERYQQATPPAAITD
jgi:hypothetical protein